MPTTFPAPRAGPPPLEALRFFEDKNLRPGFSYLDVWREEHTYSFTVAKIMEDDVLNDVRDSIRNALADGVPFEQWAKDIRPTFDKSGWTAYGTEADEPYRLRRIYETNMRVARATGQWERIQRTKKVLPYLKYGLGPSEHHRPEHEEWDGLVLPADDPWWDEHYPPNGWGCKCGVIQISNGQAEGEGVDEAPPDEEVEWTNPKTGDTEQVPKGIDPGWNYNPGKERAESLQEAETE